MEVPVCFVKPCEVPLCVQTVTHRFPLKVGESSVWFASEKALRAWEKKQAKQKSLTDSLREAAE